MSVYWYALRSKPRKEEVVYRQILNQNIEVYYPRLRVHPINPRARKIQPYFPGYLFVHVDLYVLGLSYFKWMPYTQGLVCFGEEPAIVPEHLILELKRKVHVIAEAGGEFFNGLKSGETVYIRQGPFAGYEAIFDTRIPGSERVRVLLKLLYDHRQVPLELDVKLLERKKK
ncbi:MAG: Transcriptional activator RfaH [Anaerolineae bacterium]|nr:MAG: Transcriptional activator RfaH [Anaerolineae bacterium]